MKIKKYIIPGTKLGTLSCFLIVFFIILIIIANIIVQMQEPRNDKTFFDNPLLSGTMLIAVLSGISSFILGTTAIIWKKERASLVFISSLLGLLVLVFIIGEFLVEH